MAPVTECVLAPLKPGTNLEALYKAAATTKAQPGNQGVRAGVLHEDPNQVRLFIGWDAIESHQAFRASPRFATFMGEIAPHAAGPTTVMHAELAPHPPAVLDTYGGVAEVLFAYFAPGADAGRNMAAAQGLVEGLRGAGFAGLGGESAVGWTVERDVDYGGEETRVLVILLGWDSVDAYEKARATDVYGRLVAGFRGAAEGFKGFDISHVTTKTL
ncbi:hypothetical protein F4818DRAFT_103162 [Hypoxylon cercidicola]|nr:hypothetical protein F4818DRAFT_103162 [Hypoxylon cercidicola]